MPLFWASVRTVVSVWIAASVRYALNATRLSLATFVQIATTATNAQIFRVPIATYVKHVALVAIRN